MNFGDALATYSLIIGSNSLSNSVVSLKVKIGY